MSREQPFAYQVVYRYLLQWLDSVASDQEQRLPSLRELAQRLKVSLSTTKYAYALLEDEGRICSRPRQGYFTRVRGPAPLTETGPALLDNLYAQARQPGRLALCSDAPAMLLSLEHPLLMTERELARQYPRNQAPLYQPLGEQELRSELARRYTRSTCDYWQADQVYLGADLRSVLEVSLQALDLAGNVALVESPCSWAVLRQLRAARLRIIELPLNAAGRFDLQQLQDLLRQQPVRVAVLSSTVNIPHGSLMPAADKQQLCQWFTERGVWLLENDSYGPFSFVPDAARYRDFADPERLLVFACLDKVIGAEAPFSYVLSRSLGPQLQRQFLERSFRLSPIRQKAVARLFSSGRIDQHLLKLRGMLQQRMGQLHRLLDEQAGAQLHASLPAGGATLWVEARRPVAMARVYEQLLAQGIVIAPGAIFSQQGLWQHHLRLSYTLDWSKDIAAALRQLAQAVAQAS
ncbi:aminotransferase class I/II-fold pyridoxal phosphate-dependent enzyme [Pseudomonas sp. Fl5BN2]|uniref:aminotransferase-like domain-containing protein n=1 Tax=unclassified Pseudomonas TaxID=196821 RepID=UPI001377CE9B|nr:aminotransferase class I/II-fold pyridoxal phosphate-dependent enzyme [Pseudomonas sp. Fl5BN2]NBF12476.1 aminotransferase class I/II-fold pyridoxal phosphate-dependent enzyme [Pseudomonas sp. Fl4BN1]